MLYDLFNKSSRILYDSDKLDNTFNFHESFTYTMERLRAYYQDQGISKEIINTVAGLFPKDQDRRRNNIPEVTNPLDFDRRVNAVKEFVGLAEAESLAASSKRISNILQNAQGSGTPGSLQAIYNPTVNESLLQESAEKSLYTAVNNQQEKLSSLFEKGDYSSALSSLANLRENVDNFFDDVMVMVDDRDIRNNRLALLSQLRNLFLNIADLSRL